MRLLFGCLVIFLSGCGPVLIKDTPEYKQALEVVNYCQSHGYPMRVIKSDVWGTPQLWDQDDGERCKAGLSLDRRCKSVGLTPGTTEFASCREALYRQDTDRQLMATTAMPIMPLPRVTTCIPFAGTIRCTEQ